MRGANIKGGLRQSIIVAILPENCMKLKKLDQKEVTHRQHPPWMR